MEGKNKGISRYSTRIMTLSVLCLWIFFTYFAVQNDLTVMQQNRVPNMKLANVTQRPKPAITHGTPEHKHTTADGTTGHKPTIADGTTGYKPMLADGTPEHKPTLAHETPGHMPSIAYASTWFHYINWPQGDFRNFSSCRNKCMISNDPKSADAVVFHNRGRNLDSAFELHHRNTNNRRHQVFIFFGRESEIHTRINGEHLNSVFNWTATYKRDSDVITSYSHIEQLKNEHIEGKVTSFLAAEFDKDTSLIQSNKIVTGTNYAKGKNKMAVMMVNNCYANTNRLEYAKKLREYGVHVDIFGKCGKRCPGGWCQITDIAQHYKFYLAFENSHCPDYITEKFWTNALGHGMIPVALGTSKEDYLQVAPPHSFIHTADFQTVATLAEYLKLLDKNDVLYNEYFEWKKHYRVVYTRPACRLCEALHDEKKMNRRKIYSDIKSHWDATSHCQNKGPLPLP
ncbi:glycoprotein 3-alpha-L-fucosyltransferase A-like isoform X1 [Lineus longissimus]|uniref:glycoprotein 3-alpha-L-fucosyltransferase A-like isoform X1 n=2 Tax=Lineus longissimus TaxID=88925 RepID=UPI002B4E8EC8